MWQQGWSSALRGALTLTRQDASAQDRVLVIRSPESRSSRGREGERGARGVERNQKGKPEEIQTRATGSDRGRTKGKGEREAAPHRKSVRGPAGALQARGPAPAP